MQHSWGFVSIRFPKRLPLTPSLLQPLPLPGAAVGLSRVLPRGPAGSGFPAGVPGCVIPWHPDWDMYMSLKAGFSFEWFY